MPRVISLPGKAFWLTAATVAAALAGQPTPGAAQDVVLFQDVPSVEELNAVLFGDDASPPPMKTRAIRFHDEAPPPPPPPAGSSAVASAAPSAPAPTPPPPSGTALGLNILFEFNSTNVVAESIPYLERLGEVLTLPENQGKIVNIIGHTDASGGAAYNQALSEQRALAVGQYLVDVWQVDPNRLGVEGRGKSQPLAGTDPFDGINRRVEFYALE
jgi:outer membrane protein OmpA-like peptidoglycan-associated protein